MRCLRMVGCAIGLTIMGCRTLPSRHPPLLDKEKKVMELTMCYAERAGIPPPSVSFEEKEWEKGSIATATGWWHHISYLSPWVRMASEKQLRHVSSHEVCHLKGLWSEAEAEGCSVAMRGGCQ